MKRLVATIWRRPTALPAAATGTCSGTVIRGQHATSALSFTIGQIGIVTTVGSLLSKNHHLPARNVAAEPWSRQPTGQQLRQNLRDFLDNPSTSSWDGTVIRGGGHRREDGEFIAASNPAPRPSPVAERIEAMRARAMGPRRPPRKED